MGVEHSRGMLVSAQFGKLHMVLFCFSDRLCFNDLEEIAGFSFLLQIF